MFSTVYVPHSARLRDSLQNLLDGIHTAASVAALGEITLAVVLPRPVDQRKAVLLCHLCEWHDKVPRPANLTPHINATTEAVPAPIAT